MCSQTSTICAMLLSLTVTLTGYAQSVRIETDTSSVEQGGTIRVELWTFLEDVPATAFKARIDLGELLLLVDGAAGVQYGNRWDLNIPPSLVDGQLEIAAATTGSEISGEVRLATFQVRSDTSGDYTIRWVGVETFGVSAANRKLFFAEFSDATVEFFADGQGESTLEKIAKALLNKFANADLNGDANLSFSEASSESEELTQEHFDEIDTDDNGLLSMPELEAVVGAPNPIGCPPDKTYSIGQFGERVSDLFVFGMALITMVAMSAVWRRSAR